MSLIYLLSTYRMMVSLILYITLLCVHHRPGCVGLDGARGAAVLFFLTSALDGMSGQCHTYFTPGKETMIQGGFQGQSG
jgi:hypothetical protein